MSKSEFGQMSDTFLLFESSHYLDFAISSNNKVDFVKVKNKTFMRLATMFLYGSWIQRWVLFSITNIHKRSSYD